MCRCLIKLEGCKYLKGVWFIVSEAFLWKKKLEEEEEAGVFVTFSGNCSILEHTSPPLSD